MKKAESKSPKLRLRRAAGLLLLALALVALCSQAVASVSRYQVLPGTDSPDTSNSNATDPAAPAEPQPEDPASGGDTSNPDIPPTTTTPEPEVPTTNPTETTQQPKPPHHPRNPKDQGPDNGDGETSPPSDSQPVNDPTEAPSNRRIQRPLRPNSNSMLAPNIDLALSANIDQSQLAIGGTAKLQITVSNVGLADASASKVTITLPSSLIFSPDGVFPSGFNSGDGVLNIGPLAAGATATFTVPVTGYQSGNSALSVRVDPTEGADLSPLNNRTTAPVSVKPTADMSVYESFSSPSAEVGDQYWAKVTVLNRGPDEAQGASIAVVVPPALSVTSGTPTKGTWTDGSNTWALPSLRDGTSATLKVSGVVTAPGDSTISASLASVVRIDPNSVGDATASSIHGLSSDMSLAEDLLTPPKHLGDTVTLEETLKNLGPDPTAAANVQVTMPKGISLLSAQPEAGTWNQTTGTWSAPGLKVGEATHLTVQAKVSSVGSLQPQVTLLKGRRFDPSTSNNLALATVHVPQAELSLSSNGPGGQVDTGANATVHLDLANHGPDAATNVTVQVSPDANSHVTGGDTGSGSFDSGSDTWTIPNIPSGGTVGLDVRVSSDNPGRSNVDAAVTGSDEVDTNSGDNSSSSRLTFALPGTVAPPDTGATFTTPTGPGVAGPVTAAAQKDKATATDPLSGPVKTVGAAAAGLALVAASGAAAGAAGAAGAGGAGGAGGGSSASGHQGDVKEGHKESKIEYRASASGHERASRGDFSSTWRTPGHAALDAAGVAAPLALARRSPLLAGIAVDGAHLRAMFGSTWVLGLLASLATGIYAAASTHGETTAPALPWLLAILAIGIIDASWGSAALFTFIISLMAWGQGIASAADVRFVVSISVLWISVPIIVGKIRTYRRNLEDGSTDKTHLTWVRLGDFLIAPLVAFWLAGTLAELIPNLSGKEMPWIEENIMLIRLVAAGVICLRVGMESAASQWYPKRMSQSCPDRLPHQEKTFSWPSVVLRSAAFAFIVHEFLGSCWQLYVATGLYAAAESMPLLKERFPDLSRLYPFLPRDLVKIVLIVGGSKLIVSLIHSDFHDPKELLRWAFMLSLVIPLFIKIGEALIRSGQDSHNWATRFAGTGVVGVFAFIVI